MTKRKGKKCDQCELFKHIKDGAGFCKFGAGTQCLNFAGNSACKMYVPRNNPSPKKKSWNPERRHSAGTMRNVIMPKGATPAGSLKYGCRIGRGNNE